jgi:hypothetical protein
MSSKTSKTQQTTSPSYTQDEIDVYRAVFEIQKKMGKQILTESQLKVLKEFGQLEAKEVFGESIQTTQQIPQTPRSLGQFSERAMGVADGVVRMLLAKVEDLQPKMFEGEEWKKLEEQDKNDARKLVFLMIFGASPEQFRLNLYKKLGGGLN